MTGPVRAAVVAGVDESPGSAAAVELAAWEATRRGSTLRLVHACRTGDVCDGWDLVRRQAARVRRRHGDRGPVERVVLPGDPGAVLVAESTAAALVVVGSPVESGVRHPWLPAVTAHVTAHAYAPAIVVRPAPPDRARSGVVVGVSGSAGAAAAVEFAFEEAAARSCRLTAVYRWVGVADDALTAQRDADELLREAMAGWIARYPDVELVCRAVSGVNPLRVILAEAGAAELIVVGAPGLERWPGVLFGSVADGLLRRAPVPVAVVSGWSRLGDEYRAGGLVARTWPREPGTE